MPPLPDNVIFIRNDTLKLIYSGMLLNFSFAEIREFWKKHPVTGINSERNEADLYRFLYNEKNRAPLKYLTSVLNDFQRLLMSKSICSYEFVRDTLVEVNHGSLIQARTLLLWIQPFIKHWFSGGDLRSIVLRILPVLTGKMAPGLVHEIVRVQENDFQTDSWIMIMSGKPPQSFHLHDKSYFEPLPRFDVELWTGSMTRNGAAILNLQPYEKIAMICDPRQISEIHSCIETYCPVQSKPSLVSKSDIETISFHQFCSQTGLDLATYKIPDCQVQVVKHTLYCPHHKTVMLYENCAYGAPVGIYRLRYKKSTERPENFLAPLFEEALGEGKSSIPMVERLHKQLLDTAALKASFVYNTSHETLTVNGEHLVKFVPAKILSKMLKSFVLSGQQEFSFRDFSYDPHIFNDHKTSNIFVRMERLSELLKQQFPMLKLKKISRGKVTLMADCQIKYMEE